VGVHLAFAASAFDFDVDVQESASDEIPGIHSSDKTPAAVIEEVLETLPYSSLLIPGDAYLAEEEDTAHSFVAGGEEQQVTEPTDVLEEPQDVALTELPNVVTALEIRKCTNWRL